VLMPCPNIISNVAVRNGGATLFLTTLHTVVWPTIWSLSFSGVDFRTSRRTDE